MMWNSYSKPMYLSHLYFQTNPTIMIKISFTLFPILILSNISSSQKLIYNIIKYSHCEKIATKNSLSNKNQIAEKY